MSEERQSKYRFYSLGIVVEDKKDGNDFIKVTPIEEITMANGLISGVKSNYKVNTPDAKGVKRANNLEGDVTIIAKWAPFSESNRITSPDVRASETVMIFTFADTGEYFWIDLGREPKLRRLEKVCYAYSNKPSGLDPFDKDSSYWVEFNTKDKSVKLHTANNDGEPFAYDIAIDSKNGTINLTDNAGVTVTIDSNTQIATWKLKKLVVDGDLDVTGAMSVSKGITGGGGGSMTGTLNVDGPINATANITTVGEVHGTNI